MSLIIASVHQEVPDHIDGADLLEIRVDAMDPTTAKQSIPSLLGASPIPTIVTCRSISEGGKFEGDEKERVDIYNAALHCDNPPRYIDIEYEALSRHPLLLDVLQSEHTGVILSWHDHTGRPSDLLQRAAAMQDIAGIDIVKMVWRARSIRDNLEAFALLQSRQQPMIAMCMGEYGLMSRVLAPKFGGFAVFASVHGCEPTAAGQPSIEVLRSLYRFKEINHETKVYGVLGNNVAHSASPAFHNAAFEVANQNAVYLPLQVPKGWEHLKATVSELRSSPSLHFSGTSITIPHKEDAMNIADNIDDVCEAVGATNTFTIHDELISASNTDVSALAAIAPQAKRVLVLGSGGVARAAIIAMAKVGAKVFVSARNTKQATKLVRLLPCELACDTLKDIDTLIHCTPVGMEGGSHPTGDCAETLAPWLSFHSQLHVIDTVYAPSNTPLIKRARDANCTVTTGDEMFRIQASEQQKLWA